MKVKRVLAAFLALVMVLGASTAIVAKDWSGVQTFDDVGQSEWYHGYVENLANQGIVSGYGKTDSFKPGNPISRQEAAKMIAEAAGLKASAGFVSKFVDLGDAGEWALKYIYALEESGVINGFGATGEFRPKDFIQRGHIALMLVRAFNLKSGPLDVLIADLNLTGNDREARAAIEILASNGIVSGFGNTNKFHPLNDIDRAGFAKMVALAQAAAAVQKAEASGNPADIAGAKALIDNLPDNQDKETQESLLDRLDETVPVSSIVVDPTTLALTIDQTGTVTATVAPDDATNKTVAWTTSDAAVATVADGVVTAVSAGAATITATAGEETATVAVTVQNNQQAAPADLAGTAPTAAGGNDGKITGVTDAMEYKLSTAAAYTAVTGTEITGLAAGTYNVRFAAKAKYDASPVAEVIVPEFAYEVIFYDEDGLTVLETLNVEEDDMPVPTVVPTKAATAEYTYTFAGWTPALAAATEDTNYKATYTAAPVNYTLTWVIDGTEVPGVACAFGTEITALLNPTPREGYTFNWDVVFPLSMPASDLTITGTWTANEYTITYMVDELQDGDVETYEYGTAITLRDEPSKDGYTFSGWDKTLPTNMPAEDLVISGTFNVNSYTVTYKVTGEEDVVETYNYGTAITLRSEPLKNGYTFSGWTPTELPATMPADDLEVTGAFSINQYTITFVSDGTDVAPITQNYDTDVVAPTAPTRTGYTFNGWSPSLPGKMPAENQTHTALWTANEYKITYKVDGVVDGEVETYKFDDAISLRGVPSKEGYTFSGWSPTLPPNMPAENLVISGTFAINQYTITYKIDGEIDGEVETYDFGAEISLRSDPTKTGHIFSGWDPAELPDFMPANNLIINGSYTTDAFGQAMIDVQAAIEAATNAVETAEDSWLNVDFDAARALVEGLIDFNNLDFLNVPPLTFEQQGQLKDILQPAYNVLNGRLNALEADINSIVNQINWAQNELKLHGLLSSDPFEHYNEDNITEYKAELDKHMTGGALPRTFKTVDEIQDIITIVNVREAMDAEDLFDILETAGFENLNPNLKENYFTAIPGNSDATKNVFSIQWYINHVNTGFEATATAAVVAAETPKLTQDKVDAAQLLVDKLPEGDIKAALQVRLDDVQDAVNAGNAFIDAVRGLPSTAAIAAMDSVELAAAKTEVAGVRNMYDALSPQAKEVLNVLWNEKNNLRAAEAAITAREKEIFGEVILALPVEKDAFADEDFGEGYDGISAELEAAHKGLEVAKEGKKITLTGKANYVGEGSLLGQFFNVTPAPNYYIGLKFDVEGYTVTQYKSDWGSGEWIAFDGDFLLALIGDGSKTETTLTLKYEKDGMENTVVYEIDYTDLVFQSKDEAEAILAVEIAEESLKSKDYNYAKDLVDALNPSTPDGEATKAELLARLAVARAKRLVAKAVSTKDDSDITKAWKAVDALPEDVAPDTTKADLLESLDNLYAAVTKITKDELVLNGHTGSDGNKYWFSYPSVNKVNCEHLTVSRVRGTINITSDLLIRVNDGDYVDGFGTITITQEQKDKHTDGISLIAFKIGSEPHIWLVGSKTDIFDITYQGITYKIDVTGLDWTTSAVIPAD